MKSRLRVPAAVIGLLIVLSLTGAPRVRAATSLPHTVDQAVARAADDGIQQSVTVVDRGTGAVLASNGGSQEYISESIVKLFTVAYNCVQHDGHPDADLAATLRYMIVHSDDRIESQLWSTDIVPTMAARYHLAHTRNGPKTGPHDWGWELLDSDDEANFLFRMASDPQVAPLLLPAMADVAATGSDGFDQYFGLNAMSGDHGSKQGWTDVGSSTQVQIHSVGWVGHYFVAILQTSNSASYDSMRAASTRTALAIAATETATTPTSPAQTGTTVSAPTAAAPAPPMTSRSPPSKSSSLVAPVTTGPGRPGLTPTQFLFLQRFWRTFLAALRGLV